MDRIAAALLPHRSELLVLLPTDDGILAKRAAFRRDAPYQVFGQAGTIGVANAAAVAVVEDPDKTLWAVVLVNDDIALWRCRIMPHDDSHPAEWEAIG